VGGPRVGCTPGDSGNTGGGSNRGGKIVASPLGRGFLPRLGFRVGQTIAKGGEDGPRH